MSALIVELEQREFQKALREVMDLSEPRAARDVITNTAKFVVRRLVFRTEQLTNFKRLARRIVRSVYGKSSARAVAALLEGRGHPKAVGWMKWARDMQSIAKMGWGPAWRGIGNAGLPPVKKPGQEQHGSFVDQRGILGHPYVELTNNVSFAEKLDERKDIVAGSLHAQTEAMNRWLFKKYTKMLKGHSGR